MDTFRQQFEALLEQMSRGTYAQEVAAYEALRSMTPEAAAYSFNLLRREAAEERDYGCTVVHWLLNAALDEDTPVPPELEGFTPVLLQLALHDPSPEVRASAGGVLSQLKVPEAVPILCGLVDGTELARETAAGCLASFGPEEWQNPTHAALRSQAASALLRLTYDPEVVIRGQAVCSLGHGGHETEDVRQRLLTLLDDDNAHVRAYSARVLGDFREPRLVPILETRLRDEDEMRAAWWGYFDAVNALQEPALLSAAEAGAEIVRRIQAEWGDPPDTSIEWTLKRLREAPRPRA